MTAKSILAMNWTMGNNEHIADAQAKERAVIRNARHEANEICKAIEPFFTDTKWAEWIDAGPDDVKKFVRYAKSEWLRIAREFEIKLTAADVAELRA